MVFSSPIFLFLFLPVCLVFYLLTNVFGNVKAENICLLIFSLIFYAYGSLDFLPILLGSIVINYIFSLAVSKISIGNVRLFIATVSIFFNVGLLFIYKYLNLFTATFMGSDYATDIKLPIGISFYTFQVISYLADVYKRDAKPCNSVIDFALYTMLFPQLIAGPIVRYSIVDEELRYRRTTFNGFTEGIKRFMIGFSKKIVLANTLGKVADMAFDQLSAYRLGPLLSSLVIICYTMQIYLDFFAYSDMAIGIGKIFGFSFPENFDNPFTANTVTTFWNKWHMTLSTFFRDYVYIPLGGNRKGLLRTCINLTIVFTLSGLWHGASFNFLFWGVYNAFFLVVERLFLKKILDKIPATIGIFYTFVVWNVGMVFFRLESLNEALIFLHGFFTTTHFNYYTREIVNEIFNPFFITIFIISLIYLTPIFGRIKEALYRTYFGFLIVDIVVIVMFLYAVTEMLTSGFNPFIYFRF